MGGLKPVGVPGLGETHGWSGLWCSTPAVVGIAATACRTAPHRTAPCLPAGRAYLLHCTTEPTCRAAKSLRLPVCVLPAPAYLPAVPRLTCAVPGHVAWPLITHPPGTHPASAQVTLLAHRFVGAAL